MLAALLLARFDIEVEVFEKKPELSRHPKAMGISRRSAEIFRQLGLLSALEEGALDLENRCLGIWAQSLVGEEWGRVPVAGFDTEFSPCEPMHCPQTWTERVLLEALEREPRARMQFGVEVMGLIPGASGARLDLSTGESVNATWVVAADGAGSGIRHQLGIETVGPGDMGHFINVHFRADYAEALRDRRAVLYHALSEQYFENFVAINGQDLWLMHHFLQPGEAVTDYSPERLVEIIGQASGLPEVSVEVLGLSPWVMSPKAALSLREGQVFLVGDAAARLSPAGGLGLNTGLQTVHNLAWKLAAVVRGEAGERLLDSYQDERSPMAFATMENTNHNAEEIFSIVESGLKGDWASVRAKVAHSRRRGAGFGQDLGGVYERGALVPDGSEQSVPADSINDYLPAARPGHRAPHLKIEAGGRSLLDLLGGRFCLLIGRDGEKWRTALNSTRVVTSRCQNEVEFSAPEFENLYGIERDGAVLIRPDGYVGARFVRCPKDPQAELDLALAAILAW